MHSLLENNARGFIPLEEETVEAFLARTKRLAEFAKPYQSKAVLQAFDLAIDWLPLVYQRKGLRFWEGGACWIGEAKELCSFFSLPPCEEKGPFCIVQVTPKLQGKKRYWFCDIEELVAHEAVHAARLGFGPGTGDRFEEILAYATSKRGWRRVFGPLFRSSKEVSLFCFVLVGAVSLQMIGSLIESRMLFLLSLLFPWAFLMGFVARLFWSRRVFQRAYKKLEGKVLPHPLAVLVRLTDREIEELSRVKGEAREWAKGKSSWRGAVLYSYFLRKRAEGMAS